MATTAHSWDMERRLKKGYIIYKQEEVVRSVSLAIRLDSNPRVNIILYSTKTNVVDKIRPSDENQS